MPKRRNISQENATPGTESAFASSELPTVESILPRPGKVNSKTCRASSRLRVVLAAVASITAVVILVFFCSRIYKRRALQDLRSRRLANSDDSDEPIDACGISNGEEEEQEHQRHHTPSLPSGGGRHLPFKKRLSARVAVSGVGGDGRSHQQREHLQHQDEALAGAGAFGLFPPPPTSGPEQFGTSPITVTSSVPSGGGRTAAELGAARGLLNLRSQHHGVRGSARGPMQRTSVLLRQQRGQLRRMQRHMRRLKQQLRMEQRYRQQQQRYLQQQQYLQDQINEQVQLYLQQLLSQQRLQQQSWLQEEQHLHWQHRLWQQGPHQQTLLQQQEQHQLHQQVVQDYERHQVMQQEGHLVHWEQERVQQHPEDMARWGEQHEPKQIEERQQQLLHPVYKLSGQLAEDEWIDEDSPSPQAPQPSTSQQELSSYDPAAAEGPSPSQEFSRQESRGLSQAPVDASSGAPAAGTAATSAAAARDSGSSVAESTTAVEASGFQSSMLSSLLMGESTEGAATAEKTIAAAGEGSDIPASASTSTSAVPSGEEDSTVAAILEHPYVRLPKRLVDNPFHGKLIRLRRAISASHSKRHPVPLLQRAHELLSRRVLPPFSMKELAEIAEDIVTHLLRYHHYDLSKQVTCRAVERLAMRFLLFDVVVSAFIVLGEEPDDQAWVEFTEIVSDAAPPMSPRGTYPGLPYFNSCLGKRLSDAIKVLKTGKRPEPKDLLKIKQMIFCSKHSPPRMKSEEFDPWREDNSSRSSGP